MKFTVQNVLARVTTSEKSANEILATYGDGDAQVAQKAEWVKEGWKFDDAKSEWFFLHPVPRVVVNGDPELKLPAKSDLSEADYTEFQNANVDLYQKLDEITEAADLSEMLSAGYQYKTRPNFKKKSKGRDSLSRLEKLAALNREFLTKHASNPAKMGHLRDVEGHLRDVEGHLRLEPREDGPLHRGHGRPGEATRLPRIP